MNTLKKITLVALILGAGAQTINAHPWTTRAIAAATLTGLGLGYGTVKYYGFNTITNAVLAKCTNAKNWFSSKLSDAVYGSYKKQIAQLKQENAKIIEEICEFIPAKDAHFKQLEIDKLSQSELVDKYSQDIKRLNNTLKIQETKHKEKKAEMRKMISNLSTPSLAVVKLQKDLAEQEQTNADLRETLTQMQAQLSHYSSQSILQSDEDSASA